MTRTAAGAARVAIDALLERRGPDGRRLMVGIAGPPGAGKSTLAEAVCAAFEARRGPGFAGLAPMDGFHLSAETLARRGLTARKGAPETFDAAGYLALLRRLQSGERRVAVPAYSRAIHDVAPDAAVLEDPRLVLAEGNYLLLAAPPWDAIGALFDLRIGLSVPWAICEARLLRRHRAGGRTEAEARAKIDRVDRPNFERIAPGLARADLVLAGG